MRDAYTAERRGRIQQQQRPSGLWADIMLVVAAGVIVAAVLAALTIAGIL